MLKKVLLWGMVLSVMLLTGCSIEVDKPKGGGGGGRIYLAGWIRTHKSSVPRQETFYNHIEMFNEINPAWYDVTKTNMDNLTYDSELYSKAKQNGVKVIPTLQNVGESSNGAEKVNSLLATEEERQKHVADIVKLVNEKGFDGIDIDYENVKNIPITNDNQEFDKFIALLSTELAKTNKLLSVCVYLPGYVRWQNYSELLKYVDTLKVMVYNCDITSNPVPSPICSLSALRTILNYARGNAAAKQKIIIGLPFYGRHWTKTVTEGTVKYSRDELLYIGVQELMRSKGITEDQLSRKDGEAYFTFQDTDGEHTVYFQDDLALRTRLDVIASYLDVIKGVTFWDLGGEDPESWKEVARYK